MEQFDFLLDGPDEIAAEIAKQIKNIRKRKTKKKKIIPTSLMFNNNHKKKHIKNQLKKKDYTETDGSKS